MSGIRIRLSSREAASLRISLTGRIQRLRAYIKENEGSDVSNSQSLLKHLIKLHGRLHKATYGTDYDHG
jgi:hypothetical protein